jgi:NADH-quinone oxidoreductase subunit N
VRCVPRDSEICAEFAGWTEPAASAFKPVLLSLAGVPATMGFLGKFYVLAAGAASAAWLLMIVLVVTSVAGLFYYLRIVVTLYSTSPDRATPVQSLPRASAFIIWGLAVPLVWFGVNPAPLLNLVHRVMAGIT